MGKLLLVGLVLAVLAAGCVPRAIDEVDRSKAANIDASTEATKEAIRHEEKGNRLNEQFEEDMLPTRREKQEQKDLWLLAAFCVCLVALCVAVLYGVPGSSFHGVRLVAARADKAKMEARFVTQEVRGPLDVVNIHFSKGVVSTTAANLFLHGGVVVDDKTGEVAPIGPMERDQIPELARVLGMSSAALEAARQDGQFVITAGDFSRAGDEDQPRLPQTRRGKLLEG